MSNRILVKAAAYSNSISFRTVTQKRKSPQCFHVLRSELERLWREGSVITGDLRSFAVLRYGKASGVVSIQFTWLKSAAGEGIAGWEQTVRLPYGSLARFVENSLKESGPKQWQALSKEEVKRPRLVFSGAQANLHAAVSHKAVRRKLARFLRDHFNWSGADQICFYNDFVPYSFYFREFRGDGQPGICGGVILHGQEDLDRANYSLHT